MNKNRLEAFSDRVIAIPLAFYQVQISLALFALVAVMWFIPDRRIERQINGED